LLVVGEPTVLIAGQMAARVGDNQVCPLATEAGLPHVGGAVTDGSTTVFIGGKLAARVGDGCDCLMAPDAPPGTEAIPNVIASGTDDVLRGLDDLAPAPPTRADVLASSPRQRATGLEVRPVQTTRDSEP
jgi:uncharacterized Zn-binding protein involved in type VI secretion